MQIEFTIAARRVIRTLSFAGAGFDPSFPIIPTFAAVAMLHGAEGAQSREGDNE